MKTEEIDELFENLFKHRITKEEFSKKIRQFVLNAVDVVELFYIRKKIDHHWEDADKIIEINFFAGVGYPGCNDVVERAKKFSDSIENRGLLEKTFYYLEEYQFDVEKDDLEKLIKIYFSTFKEFYELVGEVEKIFFRIGKVCDKPDIYFKICSERLSELLIQGLNNYQPNIFIDFIKGNINTLMPIIDVMAMKVVMDTSDVNKIIDILGIFSDTSRVSYVALERLKKFV